MICNRQVLLILDTNILADILDGCQNDLFARLVEWIKSVIEVAPCSVDNRRLTLAVSTKVLSDYKTGLSRRHLNPKLINGLEFSLLSNIKTPVPIKVQSGRMLFVPVKFAFDESRIQIRDRYDRKFGYIITGILQSQRYTDRLVILACRDHSTIRDFERSRSRDVHDESKFRLETSLEGLEILLKDP